MSFEVFGHAEVRPIFHRFRGCSDGHRDRYHEECPNCILIESNVDRCIETSHIKDGSGRCLTCELFDGRVAGHEDHKLVQLLRKLRKD